MTTNSLSILALCILTLSLSCKKSPRIIMATEENVTSEPVSGIFQTEKGNTTQTPIGDNQNSNFLDNMHSVVVNKALPANKYVYLNVTENGKSFWIATRTIDVSIGSTYFYRDGLLKTHFESKEYQKTFDTIYLVSNLVPQMHGRNSPSISSTPNFTKSPVEPKETVKSSQLSEPVNSQEGSIKIAEIVEHPEKYENTIVQVTGKIVKVNPNIMNRNWYHLQDGSMDDFDFVVTSDTYVPEGHIITVKAEVHRNVDFGAGYKYELILENAEIISR